MNESNRHPPESGGDFPEIELGFDGTIEEEILRIVIEALHAQGYPSLDIESVRSDPQHREAALDMLRDCRPLPVIRGLIAKIESGCI